jgi:CheY-like chemotaxis protein
VAEHRRIALVVDGEQGLDRAVNGGFDVIVLDLGLPRLDGLELCRRLRSAGSGVPVLMLTALSTRSCETGTFGPVSRPANPGRPERSFDVRTLSRSRPRTACR